MVYVYNILAISMNPTETLKMMEGKTVKYKNGKITPPEMYLVEKFKRKLMNGNMCCTITSYDYIIATMQKINDAVKDKILQIHQRPNDFYQNWMEMKN